jgi:hypothetical protein
MPSNMERETLCKPNLTDLGDLELDIDLLFFYDLTKFPNFSWSSLIRLRPIAIILNRETEDYCDAIPFGETQLYQRLHILASINNVNPTASCSDLFEIS